jgi:energy-coupling factor transporter ATP-binding protein EcfA2
MVNDLTIKPIPVDKSAHHPDSKYSVLPPHEFTLGLIAPKGSGKTTLMVNLLIFYKEYFHTILIFSPTISSDDKWDWVKKQDFLGENKKLKEWMDANDKQQNKVVTPPFNETLKKTKKFDGKIPKECFYTEYDENTLSLIMKEQMDMIQLLEKHKKTKHLANRILIIFDDLVGSKLFSNQKQNPFKTLNTNHRHYSTSILMVSQAYKEVCLFYFLLLYLV